MYEHENLDMEKIFHLAIEAANQELEDVRLHGVTNNIEANNAFESSKKLCKMLKVIFYNYIVYLRLIN